MRTKLYSLMAWIACLTMASCTNQEIIEQAIKPVHSNTLNVLTEKQESRSVLSYEGTFYWTENDYIGVYGTETENARFHFTSQADGVSTFTGNMNASEEKVSWAYFPYSEKVDVNKKQLSFPMPAERTISNENHSPMIGRVEANNTVRFYHTGGILHLKIVGLPEHAAQLVITSEGENSPCLAGTAVIDDITADGCTYRIDNGSKEVVYDVRNLKGGEYIYSIYMPLQIGTYEKIKVTLKNEVGGIIKERSLSNLIVIRGKMTDTPTLHFSDKIYAYDVSKEYLSETSWDGGTLFSNDVFMVYKTENIDGAEYLFLNTFYDGSSDNLKILEAFFDEDNHIIELRLGKDVCYFSNYTDNSFDLTVLRNYSYFEEYKGVKYNRESRAMGTGDNRYENLQVVGDVLEIAQEVCDIAGNDNLQNNIKNARLRGVVTVIGHPITEATLEATGLIVDISEEAVRIENEGLYETFINDARVRTLPPRLTEDGNSLIIGYTLVGTASLDYDGTGVECGLMIEEVNNKNQRVVLNYNRRNVRREILIPDELHLADGIKLRSIQCTPGSTYVVRAYIRGWTPGRANNPICDYGDYERITVPNCYLTNVRVEPCRFFDGYYHFEVRTEGYSSDETNNYFTNIYKNEGEGLKLYDYCEWYGNNRAIISLILDPSEMDYVERRARGDWTIGASMGFDVVPTNLENVDLRYDVEPDIHLDVQIIDGPRPINNSRAADDDNEEKYYVKYSVKVTTEGSGWIKKVYTKSSDGEVSEMEYPKNETETYSPYVNKYGSQAHYVGSYVYKDKSELPIITSIATLLDGSTKVKHVEVASRVN